ncbi:GNAT family N-acetyltransferase [Oricola indica]|uniref:GNAT family N-acetyltransferase n=1 Tax=Oricola indica TaxID=2872591 RepID=UPI003CCB9B1D
MVEYTDKKGRKIFIDLDGCNATAFYNGNQIGEVTTTGLREIDTRTAPLPAKLTGIFVDDDYQRAGIATEMIRWLHEDLGELCPGDHNIGIGDQNAMTDAGEAVTRRCQDLGYVLPFPNE